MIRSDIYFALQVLRLNNCFIVKWFSKNQVENKFILRVVFQMILNDIPDNILDDIPDDIQVDGNNG